MPRRKTKVDLLLDILGDFLWHSKDELHYKVSPSFGDAIYKARKIGHNIETDRSENRYRLLAK